MLRSSRVLLALVVTSLLGGCTAILGIDESFDQAGEGADGGTKPGTDASLSSGDGSTGTDATTGGDAQVPEAGVGPGGEAGTLPDGGASPAWILDTTFAASGQAAITDAGVSADPVSLVIDDTGRVFVIGATAPATGAPKTAYWIVATDAGTQPPPTPTGLDHPTDAVLGSDGNVYVATTTSYEDEGSSSSVEVTGLLAPTGFQHPYGAGNVYVQRLVSVSGSGPTAHFYTTMAHDSVEVLSLDLDSGTVAYDFSLSSDWTDIYAAVTVGARDVVAGANENIGPDQQQYGVVDTSMKKETNGAVGSGFQYTDVLPLGTGYVAVGPGETATDTNGIEIFHVVWLSAINPASDVISVTMDQEYLPASDHPLVDEPVSHTRLAADGDSFLAAAVVTGDSTPTLIRFGIDGGRDEAFGNTSPPVVLKGYAALGGMAIHGGLLYVAYTVSGDSSVAWVVARYRRSGS